jgi:O-antigen/teichoic acid export membrane protein
MVASVFGALLNIGLNYIFIPIYGFVAAGYTTLFCYIVFSVMHGIFAITILRENKVKILPFRIKAIVILSLVIIAIMIGITILYAYSTIIRYIMCGAVLAFMTLNIKRIIGLVKGLKS